MRINSDEVKGKMNQASGTVKETMGRAMGDPNLEKKGAAQRVSGRVQEGFGKARRKVGEAMKDAGDKLRK
ncbi:MAG TPA: CsbD family protein [Thermoanaerobaculia bacterium]|jgi:uncharacterized protein YjbJ (UPF0337 family)|nr:CsbD family protein [Thermoanaerobaculia bacterium]